MTYETKFQIDCSGKNLADYLSINHIFSFPIRTTPGFPTIISENIYSHDCPGSLDGIYWDATIG